MADGVRAYIGMGGNLGDVVATLKQALRDLDGLPSTRCTGWSHGYRNPPVGPQDQGFYVNAVAAVDTRLRPLDLLSWLQRIEKRQGRVRGRRWGARTLDLDLLIYGTQRLSLRRLDVPHPRLHQRAFVVCPLVQFGAEIAVPGRAAIGALRARCSSRSLQRVTRRWPSPAARQSRPRAIRHELTGMDW